MIHSIVFALCVFSIVITLVGIQKSGRTLFQGGFYDTLFFVLTIYILALIIIPLLFNNWKKYLYIAIMFIIFYSIFLGWIRVIRRSSSMMINKGISTEPLEYFTLEYVLNSSLTLIPMGVMGLIYALLVIDIKILKRVFAVKRFDLIFNSTVIALIYFYALIMPRKIEIGVIAFISVYIVFFYLNTFYLTPLLLKKKSLLKYSFLSFLSFVIVNALAIVLLDFIYNYNLLSRIYPLFFRLIPIYFLLYIVSFIYGYLRLKIKEKNLQIGAKDSELKLLKSQVNPHFLFNTLNTLYSTALEENAPKTAESTAKLASLIRYMQEDINKDFIPLENEIKYLQDYITIQKLRCAVEPEIETKFNVIESHKISPGLLIPFVENAFKYGIDSSKKSKLFVSVICDENTIDFKCMNSYDENFKTYYKEQGFGIGIKNAKERLGLVYPKKHTFEVKKENNIFSVKINITIK
ncbi:sensor histidine kinase [Sabulilitoribacter arenilitoris]|uniref:Sensor histidine kinase n=1 Tax=Wocania arenilitoris TaxID=2044858 RepID=A0AAE3EL69_9FLAO|nr:histidine kinase [Wocania arenilitoris]MCF7566892.1 sensor histidine kinase [Wocania arenilitoris]